MYAHGDPPYDDRQPFGTGDGGGIEQLMENTVRMLHACPLV